MQIYPNKIKGIYDHFEITSGVDHHNQVKLNTSWLIFIFNTKQDMNNFVNMVCNGDKIGYEYDAITIPLVFRDKIGKNNILNINLHGYICFYKNRVNSNTIAHECFHAAHESVVRKLKYNYKNMHHNEMMAYLVGNYVESFYNEYSNRKSRVKFFRTKSNSKSKKGVHRRTKEKS